MEINIKETATIIANELMYENKEYKVINDDTLEKDCYWAVADIKNDIRFEVEKILEENNFTIK